MIRVNLLQQGLLDRPEQTFEELWSCAVLTLQHHQHAGVGTNLRRFGLGQDHAQQLYPVDDAKRVQYGSATRAFYLNFFLPWLRSKNLDPTRPDRWRCEDFRNPDTLHWAEAMDGGSTYLSFYENTYDMQAAYLEGNRGNYAKAKEISTRQSSPTLQASTQMNSSEPTDS